MLIKALDAWNMPAELNISTDEFVIPDRWMNVLYAQARYYMWQFKESPQQAGFARQEFRLGIAKMRNTLIETASDVMKDDRIRLI